MKIYFGRYPKGAISLDSLFEIAFKTSNFNFDTAVALLIELIIQGKSYYSINPLIFNYMDDNMVNCLYLIDELCNEIYLGDDRKFNTKLDCMGLGEALCDDIRSYSSD